MSNYLKYALTIQNEKSEERELLKLSTYIKSLFIKISCLNMDMTENFYGGLITKLRSLIYEYVLEKQNTICSPMHKYLYLLYELYQKLSEITFMNKKFLINFLFKRIFLFYDALHSQECNNVMIINDSIINICKGEITPIIEYCSYSIVNKFIFEDKNKLEEMDYFFKYIKECAGFSDWLLPWYWCKRLFLSFRKDNTTKMTKQLLSINSSDLNDIEEEFSSLGL